MSEEEKEKQRKEIETLDRTPYMKYSLENEKKKFQQDLNVEFEPYGVIFGIDFGKIERENHRAYVEEY
jgi:hypothetical protein